MLGMKYQIRKKKKKKISHHLSGYQKCVSETKLSILATAAGWAPKYKIFISPATDFAHEI